MGVETGVSRIIDSQERGYEAKVRICIDALAGYSIKELAPNVHWCSFCQRIQDTEYCCPVTIARAIRAELRD